MLVTVPKLVHLRYFLKAAVLHHFPSGVVPCLSHCVPLFTYGVFCRSLSCTTSLPELGDACYGTHACSFTLFSEGSCSTPVPFRSGGRILLRGRVYCTEKAPG